MRWSWSWTPVVAIAAAAVANAAMIATSLVHPPESVSGLRSGEGVADAGVAARRRFAEADIVISVSPSRDGLRVDIDGKRLAEATVACERPGDAALDTQAAWTDSTVPLEIPLPRSGRWTVRISGQDTAGHALEGVSEVLLP